MRWLQSCEVLKVAFEAQLICGVVMVVATIAIMKGEIHSWLRG